MMRRISFLIKAIGVNFSLSFKYLALIAVNLYIAHLLYIFFANEQII
jgi:hypothetical protein